MFVAFEARPCGLRRDIATAPNDEGSACRHSSRSIHAWVRQWRHFTRALSPTQRKSNYAAVFNLLSTNAIAPRYANNGVLDSGMETLSAEEESDALPPARAELT